MRVLISAGTQTSFEGAPTFGDLGYTADIGLMHRVVMAPTGTPDAVIEKLRSALKAIQDDKTYLKLIKAIGETTDYGDGPEYEAQRPLQSAAYKEMVQQLVGN